MKVTLISLGLATDAIGIRILSALLKMHGHKTQLVFLPTRDDLLRRVRGGKYSYNEEVLRQMRDLCHESNLVGLSLMTHHYSVAKELTQILKTELRVPVIWGGIHATVCPEECLGSADMVCCGEGETSVIELARRMDAGQDYSDIHGIWLKKDGKTIANGVGPLANDLDSLPFPDYSFDDSHLLVEGRIQPMTAENLCQHLLRFFPPLNRSNPDNPAYQVLSARGCPFSCSFCGEVPLMDYMYGRRYFRKRKISNLIKELQWAKAAFPFIGEICFCDDTFPSRGMDEIRDFCRQYKEEIALPFYVLASPVNVTKEKFDLLVDAGLTNVGVGIQTGSSRIISLYRRDKVGSVKQLLKAAEILNSYKDRLTPYYDFIIENPYETREDLLETIRLLIKLPRPYETRVYALSFFPGTPLYEKASADGILYSDIYDKTFGQRTRDLCYLDFIVDLNKYHPPRFLLQMFISKPVRFFLNRPPADRFFFTVRRFMKWVAMKLHYGEKGLS